MKVAFPTSSYATLIVAILIGWLAAFPTVAQENRGSQIQLTPEEQAFLRDHPVVRVHNETDWPPFNYAENGVAKGYSIDYMNLLASKVGLKVEYVTGPTWNEFMEMMKTGDLDVMLNIVKTPERQQYLLYTPPYADNPNTILSRREQPYDSLDQLFGKTVSIPKGFFYEEILRREFPQIKLLPVKNTIESMKAVSFGKADAAVGELAVFNHLVTRNMMTDLEISGEVKMGDPEYSLLNIATRKDLPILASILTKGVASITPEEEAALREKTGSFQFQIGIDTKTVQRIAIQAGVVVAIVLLVIVIWNRRLQREILQRKKAEMEMEAAKNEAERLTHSKSEFIAAISHEVRTPMNGVLGMARLLTEMKLDKEQRSCVNTIVASGEELITIINDLLDLSKLEANRLEIENRPFSIDDAVKQAVALMKSPADEKGLSLICSVDENIPDVVIGDTHRLRQIILNFISNAIKFTDVGTISLDAKFESQSENMARLIITVSDTGRGITPNVLEKLFSDYTQGSVEVARKYGGTGLGLAICRRLAELMGGEITVESIIGQGSAFSLTAPFAIGRAEDLELIKERGFQLQPTDKTKRAERPLRVLQAEDNQTNRAVVEQILTRVGHTVISAENGEQAVAEVKKGTYDVVLMDRHMPVMDGLEATRRIRALKEPIASIPIIAITAGAGRDEIAACFEAGMDECIIKPVDPGHLRSLLAAIGADGGIKEASHSDLQSQVPDLSEGDGQPINLARLAYALDEDDEAVMFKMLDIFNGEFPMLLGRIDKAIKDRDAKAVHNTAHAAKGAAANAAAPRLTALLKELQKTANQGNWDDMEARIGDVSVEYANVVQFCKDQRPVAIEIKKGVADA